MVDLIISGISDFFFFNMAVASINVPITSTLQTISQVLALSQSLGLQG